MEEAIADFHRLRGSELADVFLHCDVSAVFEQQTTHVQVVVGAGLMQRRRSTAVSRVHVCAVLEQDLRESEVAPAHRFVQRRLLERGLADVRVRSTPQQQANRAEVAATHCAIQRRASGDVTNVDVSAVFAEECDDVDAVDLCGRVHRRLAAHVHQVRIGSVLEQQPNDLRVTSLRGDQQQRVTCFRSERVDVTSAFQKALYAGDVTLLHRIDQG